jgi:hypothetical protein
MEDIEFDVNKYTLPELRAFFGLDPGKIYSETDIEAKAFSIRDQLISENCIKKSSLRQFVGFMSTASNLLIESLQPPAPTYDDHAQPSEQSKTLISAVPYIAPNEFYVKTRTQLLSVDSRFRPNAYSTNSSNFNVPIPAKLTNLASLELASFELSTLSFPNIYRAIRNHFFMIRLILCDDEVAEYIVSVNDGHYAGPELLVDAVNHAIQHCTGIYPTPNPPPFTPTPNKKTKTIRKSCSNKCDEYNNHNNECDEYNNHNNECDEYNNHNNECDEYNNHNNECDEYNNHNNECDEYEEYSCNDDHHSEEQCAPIHTVRMYYLHTTGRVAIESTHPDILAIDLDFSTDEQGEPDEVHTNAYYTRLGRVLGFTRRKYNGHIPEIGAESSPLPRHEGETRVDPYMCVRYFYLEVADFQGQYTSTFVGGTLPASVLAKIVLVEEPDTFANCRLLTKTCFISEPRVYLGPTKLNQLHIRILDSYGRIMELENTDYSFTLKFRFMYDSTLLKN